MITFGFDVAKIGVAGIINIYFNFAAVVSADLLELIVLPKEGLLHIPSNLLTQWLIKRFSLRCSISLIGCTIFVDECPVAVLQQRLEIVIGIGTFVARCSVPDFEI